MTKSMRIDGADVDATYAAIFLYLNANINRFILFNHKDRVLQVGEDCVAICQWRGGWRLTRRVELSVTMKASAYEAAVLDKLAALVVFPTSDPPSHSPLTALVEKTP